MTTAPVKVSVVVPVYNGARHIGTLIDSLLRQSMPAGEFEAVLVDDGSTDETPQLLDSAAAEHRQLKVIHQANSGWPGKPRNVGIDASRGDYVFFADADDWLGVEALSRLHSTAVRTDADIVLGKMVGHGRGVPREIFRRSRDRATLADAPLVDSMTPHKLFRRSFLDRQGLRFPEERRRLEDHVFVMRAFLLANYVSVIADYDCYHHARRDDETNVSLAALEPEGYYKSVREVLDIVAAHTEPGELRDRLFRRYLRVEMLGRLDSEPFITDADYGRALWRHVQRVYVDLFPPSVAASLPVRHRLLCDLLARDAYDDAVATVRWSRGLEVLPEARPAAGGVDIHVTLRTRPRLVDGDRLAPPLRHPAATDLRVATDLERASVDLLLRSSAGERLVRVPTTARVVDGGIQCVGHADVPWNELERAAPSVRVRALGWHAERELPTRSGLAGAVQARAAAARRLAVRIRRAVVTRR